MQASHPMHLAECKMVDGEVLGVWVELEHVDILLKEKQQEMSGILKRRAISRLLR